jgi:hypothetical protein
LAHLKILAEVTTHDLGAGSCKDLAAAYGSNGWRADAAVMRALACVSGMPDLDAVGVAIRCVYAPSRALPLEFMAYILHPGHRKSFAAA